MTSLEPGVGEQAGEQQLPSPQPRSSTRRAPARRAAPPHGAEALLVEADPALDGLLLRVVALLPVSAWLVVEQPGQGLGRAGAGGRAR